MRSNYCHSSSMPAVTERRIHPWMSTLRPLHSKIAVLRSPHPAEISGLTEQILKHGFVTSGECPFCWGAVSPLSDALQAPCPHQMGESAALALSGFVVKGCARMTTLLAVLHLVPGQS